MSRLAVFLFSLLAFQAGSAVLAAEMAAHRAMYEIALGHADDSTGIIGARGVMVYSMAESCDGWIVDNKSYLTLEFAEKEAMDSTWNFSSWESKDGRSFRFSIRQTENSEEIDNLRGEASLEAKGGGAVRFAKPQDLTMQLPAGAMFPTAHLSAMLAAARANSRNFSQTVFDGTSSDNPFIINAFIGDSRSTVGGGAFTGLGLKDAPEWPVRLAFFPSESRSAAPDFEIGAIYRDNGIADHIEQDFSDFTLSLKAKKIELLPKPEC